MLFKSADSVRRFLHQVTSPVPVAVLVVVLVSIFYVNGSFKNIDNSLVDAIYGAKQRSASESVIVVEIDAKSLKQFGIWPWPRSIIGQVINNLSDAGAGKIAIDVDYSTKSTVDQDRFLETAIENSDSIVIMPIFRQILGRESQAGNATQKFVDTYPLESLLPHVALASANIFLGEDGLVRDYFVLQDFDGNAVPTLATSLLDALPEDRDNQTITIDYSIDPASIPRISISDVLTDTFDPSIVRDRKVIIGATALELGDIKSVPVYRVLPGPVIIAMAYETMLAERSLQAVPQEINLALILIVSFVSLWRFEKSHWGIGAANLILGSGVLLAIAFLLQVQSVYLLDTAPIILSTTLIYLSSLFRGLEMQAVRLIFQSKEIRRTGTLMRTVVENSNDAIIVVDEDGLVLDSNPASLSLFRFTLDEMKGKHFAILFSPDQAGEEAQPFSEFIRRIAFSKNCVGKRSDSTDFVVDINYSTFEVDNEKRYAAFLRDVTIQRQQAQLLEYQAFHDGLTGLPNRELLNKRITRQIELTQKGGSSFAFFLLDLDRFKEVNDTLGHNIGDELLQAVAIRLSDVAGNGNTVARLGGDEFAFLIRTAETQEEIRKFADLITDKLRSPFELKDVSIAVEASIGMAMYPQHGHTIKQLLQCADVAMYSAKGKQLDYLFYESQDDTNSLRQLVIASSLRNAIEKEELFLNYQPRVDLVTGSVCGFEALMRWDHLQYGVIPAQEFIDIAEQSGIIHVLTRLALDQAIHQASQWLKDGHDFVVGVNLSTWNLQDESLVDTVLELLAEHNLPSNRLILEVTESAVIHKQDSAIKTLKKLSTSGVRLAIDDFGTGYSSLQYVKDLPIDELKIDKSFIFDMQKERQSKSIVQAIISMAKALQFEVVAEGIESEDIAAELRELGCHSGQGYHYGRPMPVEDIARWLGDRNTDLNNNVVHIDLKPS